MLIPMESKAMISEFINGCQHHEVIVIAMANTTMLMHLEKMAEKVRRLLIVCSWPARHLLFVVMENMAH